MIPNIPKNPEIKNHKKMLKMFTIHLSVRRIYHKMGEYATLFTSTKPSSTSPILQICI